MGILRRINEALIQPDIFVTRRRDAMYASDASIELSPDAKGRTKYGTCLRAQWYRMNGYPEDNVGPGGVAGLRKAMYGHAIEEIEKELLIRAGIQILSSELSMYWPDEHISGRVDRVIRDPENNTRAGIEYKSVQGHFGKKTINEAPKPEHMLQVMVYMAFFGQEIPVWYLMYHDREDGASGEWTLILTKDGKLSVDGVVYNEYTVENILKRYRQLWGYYLRNEIPPRDYDLQYSPEKLQWMYENGALGREDTKRYKAHQTLTKGDWQCRFCRFVKVCYGTDGSSDHA